MNDESAAIADAGTVSAARSSTQDAYREPAIPEYLEETYWWAYLHPRSIWLFEREWVVNLILWGNMRRLTNAVLEEIEPSMQGPVLQVACVYGDFSRRLASAVGDTGSRLHVADIAPIQLRNVRRKLSSLDNVTLHHQDSSELHFAGGMFEQTVVFFLLHEQPDRVRRRTITEAIRVTRPGGKVVFVDYHRPWRGNPLRYVMRPVLKTLEPFALDLWKTELSEMLPAGIAPERVSVRYYGGGLYQKVVIDC